MRSSILLMAALISTGCVKRYDGEPKLEFADIPYVGNAGNAWPLKTVELPGAAERYELSHAPKLSYVELNPEAKQTVLFLHGLGSYLKFWRSQLDETAAAGYRVIAIDQLGFGKSEKPAGFPYSTESFAENVDELLTILGIEKAIIVGHSMGGQTALSTAIRFPRRVQALVLVSPAGFEYFSGREKQWFKNVYGRVLIKDADEEAIWGAIRYQNFRHWEPSYEWLIEERVRLAKNSEFDSYAYAQVRTVEGLTKDDFVREGLGKIVAPTVIVYGTSDRLIPNGFMHGGFTKDTMEYGHEKIRGSEIVALKDCGHTLQLDCSREFNEAFFAFLKKVPVPVTEVEQTPVEAPAAP